MISKFTDLADKALIRQHCAERARVLTTEIGNMQGRQYDFRYTKKGKQYAAIAGVEYDNNLRKDVVVILRGCLITGE